MDENETQAQKGENYNRFSLYTPTPNLPGKRANLVFGSFNGQPRITVFTGHPDDKAPITAPMGVKELYLLSNRLQAVAMGERGLKFNIGCLRGEWKDDKPTGEKRHMADVIVGKDEEGMVWILLKAEGRAEIKFTFGLSEYHTYRSSDGKHTPDVLSEYSAYGTALGLKAIADKLAVTQPIVPNRGRQGGQGQQASNSSASKFGDIGF